MPEKYREILTGSSAWLALFTAAGGCLVNYISEYRHSGRLHFRWLVADLTTSCFLGYLAFWFMIDYGFTLSECAIGTCVIGNLGSRVFDIVRFSLTKKGIMPPVQARSEPFADNKDKDKDKLKCE